MLSEILALKCYKLFMYVHTDRGKGRIDTRPILVAWFCMGRLYSKILPLNVRERLDNIKKTEACYQYIIDYCKRHHKAAECMRAELEVCEEMVALLPLKMEKIRQEAEI